MNELYHYGVLGMKWGVRKGNYSSAYSKGVKKLKKLENKSAKYENKSYKLSAKSTKLNRKAYKSGDRDKWGKAIEMDAKAKKYMHKSAKLKNKGRKFYKQMERTFADVPAKSLNKADVDYGRRYASRVLT